MVLLHVFFKYFYISPIKMVHSQVGASGVLPDLLYFFVLLLEQTEVSREAVEDCLSVIVF